MGNYKLSSKAEVDVSDIYKYSKHKFSINQAKLYVSGLHNTADKLVYFKETWRPCFYIKNGLYKYYFKSHVIFFTLDDESVFIVRILHKSMDFEQHL